MRFDILIYINCGPHPIYSDRRIHAEDAIGLADGLYSDFWWEAQPWRRSATATNQRASDDKFDDWPRQSRLQVRPPDLLRVNARCVSMLAILANYNPPSLTDGLRLTVPATRLSPARAK